MSQSLEIVCSPVSFSWVLVMRRAKRQRREPRIPEREQGQRFPPCQCWCSLCTTELSQTFNDSSGFVVPPHVLVEHFLFPKQAFHSCSEITAHIGANMKRWRLNLWRHLRWGHCGGSTPFSPLCTGLTTFESLSLHNESCWWFICSLHVKCIQAANIQECQFTLHQVHDQVLLGFVLTGSHLSGSFLPTESHSVNHTIWLCFSHHGHITQGEVGGNCDESEEFYPDDSVGKREVPVWQMFSFVWHIQKSILNDLANWGRNIKCVTDLLFVTLLHQPFAARDVPRLSLARVQSPCSRPNFYSLRKGSKLRVSRVSLSWSALENTAHNRNGSSDSLQLLQGFWQHQNLQPLYSVILFEGCWKTDLPVHAKHTTA